MTGKSKSIYLRKKGRKRCLENWRDNTQKTAEQNTNTATSDTNASATSSETTS